jgi:hypothetical protein
MPAAWLENMEGEKAVSDLPPFFKELFQSQLQLREYYITDVLTDSVDTLVTDGEPGQLSSSLT